MKLGKIRILAIVIAIVIIVFVLSDMNKYEEMDNQKIEDGQLIFRMAESRCAEHPTTIASKKFTELVEERTDGKVKIILYNSSELGNETNILEQIEFGGIDFARVSTLYMSDYLGEVDVLLLPNIFNSQEHMDKALSNEVGIELIEKLKIEKINILSWYRGSARGIYSNDTMIDDLEGKKIRVPECQIKMDEISMFNASPIPAKIEDVYEYIQSGYIQGAEGDLLEYYYNSNYEVAKSFVYTPWAMVPEALVASNTAMKQLTPIQQQIIIEAAKESMDFEKKQIEEKEKEVIKELTKSGVDFIDIDDNKEKRYIDCLNRLYEYYDNNYWVFIKSIKEVGEK